MSQSQFIPLEFKEYPSAEMVERAEAFYAEIKQRRSVTAEKEEQEFYGGKAPQAWLDDLAPLGTDANKPFLETAPYLIVIFSQSHQVKTDGQKAKNYYVSESVGIATGFLISALHHAGLATLTHTPSPMKFLNTILDRPSNERPFLVLVVGYPKDDACVPAITKRLHRQADFKNGSRFLVSV